MGLVYCPGLKRVGSTTALLTDSILLLDICLVSSKCHTGFRNFGCDLIIIVHCSGENASQVYEFINTSGFVHSGGSYIPGAGWYTTYVFFVLIVRS